jgi:hypothetical protein
MIGSVEEKDTTWDRFYENNKKYACKFADNFRLLAGRFGCAGQAQGRLPDDGRFDGGSLGHEGIAAV